jgi:hypothetical protein
MPGDEPTTPVRLGQPAATAIAKYAQPPHFEWFMDRLGKLHDRVVSGYLIAVSETRIFRIC